MTGRSEHDYATLKDLHELEERLRHYTAAQMRPNAAQVEAAIAECEQMCDCPKSAFGRKQFSEAFARLRTAIQEGMK